ncbi:DUF4873 domain-containing protein [Mycolicibacterium pyrenivorans]|uniref:DUF4873 domain-containing protein n=1 Tax=Mycolicibacterium pyrenivorans TaxID=187102 RepID=UPI0021F32D0A|nr:DUF4873 domain-containing protein [Mycolicibacterium pyrenivorans]MCV7150858.1 DUF4873 domain-containing protein [Mycolicibacterium pyrenivorans]
MTDTETVVFASGQDAASAGFDEASHTWTVGDRRARVVIATDGTLPTASALRTADLEPYLGVAVHGVPNYFLLTDPDVAAKKAYVAKCLAYMSRSDSTRIEVRPGAQRFYNDRSRRRRDLHPRRGHYWRRVGRRIPSAFEVGSHTGEPIAGGADYDGPATVQIGGDRHRAHVRLTGRLDPIDGRYHWQGTVFEATFDVRLPQDVTVSIGRRAAAARLTERTPWSTHSVVGVGAPPFALDDVEIDVPLL